MATLLQILLPQIHHVFLSSSLRTDKSFPYMNANHTGPRALPPVQTYLCCLFLLCWGWVPGPYTHLAGTVAPRYTPALNLSQFTFSEPVSTYPPPEGLGVDTEGTDLLRSVQQVVPE